MKKQRSNSGKKPVVTYSLGRSFGEQVNQVSRQFDESEKLSNSDAQKAAALFEVFRISCKMLGDLDFDKLADSVESIIKNASEENPNWHLAVFGNDDLFYNFLRTFEDAIFRAHEIDADTRKRILEILSNLRERALSEIPNQEAKKIVHGIAALRKEVCWLKEELADTVKADMANKDKRKTHSRFVKFLGAVTIAVNATAPILLPGAGLAAAAASITLGGLAVKGIEKDD